MFSEPRTATRAWAQGSQAGGSHRGPSSPLGAMLGGPTWQVNGTVRAVPPMARVGVSGGRGREGWPGDSGANAALNMRAACTSVSQGLG